MMMNGLRAGGGSGGSSNSGGGGGGEVKYPANAAARFSVETNAAVSVACADGAMDKLYEPKPNKKLFRVATVIGYIFTVSMVAILLSLYYLFLWDPYVKHHKKTLERLQEQEEQRQQQRQLGDEQQLLSPSTSLKPFGLPTAYPQAMAIISPPMGGAASDKVKPIATTSRWLSMLEKDPSYSASSSFIPSSSSSVKSSKASSAVTQQGDDKLENPFTLYAKTRRSKGWDKWQKRIFHTTKQAEEVSEDLKSRHA